MNIVIVNCFDTYEQRVDLLRDSFLSMGHSVKVLTSDYRHFVKVLRTDNKEDYMMFSTQPYKKNLSFKRLRSHYMLSKDIFAYINSYMNNIDLLWVLVPPNSFVKDTKKYKYSHPSVKVVFDIIDLWPETMPVGNIKKVFPFTLWRNFRDKNIRSADFVVTECSLYSEMLSKVLKSIDHETIYLAKTNIQYNPHLSLSDDILRLCYLGSVNNIIDIDSICRIILYFRNCYNVELHIIGDGEQINELVNKSIASGASVFNHGKIYNREEKQKIFDKCHYGLNIMKKTVCVGLTMKSVDYLDLGLPIINNIKGDTWDIVDKYMIGINFSDNCDLPIKYDFSMRRNARSFFENELSYDVFRQRIDDILSRLN